MNWKGRQLLWNMRRFFLQLYNLQLGIEFSLMARYASKSALELRQATQPFPICRNLLAPVSHLVVPAARCPKSAHDVPPQSSTTVSKHGERKMVETTVFICYNLWQPINICINPAMIQKSGEKNTWKYTKRVLVAARISYIIHWCRISLINSILETNVEHGEVRLLRSKCCGYTHCSIDFTSCDQPKSQQQIPPISLPAWRLAHEEPQRWWLDGLLGLSKLDPAEKSMYECVSKLGNPLKPLKIRYI